MELLLILLVLLLVFFPIVRSCALGGVGLLFLVGFVMYSCINEEEHRKMTLIKKDEIVLHDLALLPIYHGNYDLRGTVTNKNRNHKLASFALEITAEDCNDISECIKIGEDKVHVVVTVPPGHTRSLDAIVTFTNMPDINGRMVWYYSLAGIRSF